MLERVPGARLAGGLCMNMSELRPGERGAWVRLAAVVVAAAAVVAVVAIASGRGDGYEISVEDGAFSIKTDGAVPLAKVIDDAVRADRTLFSALAAMHEFYHVEDDGLVAAVGALDVENGDHEAVTRGLRRLLWDLEGPFASPGALAGADARLIEAVLELDGIGPQREASGFLAGLLARSLAREEPFHDLRPFKAELVRLPVEAPETGRPPVIYACPPNRLDRFGITIIPPGDGELVTGLMDSGPSRLDCEGGHPTLAQMIVGHRIRLGLDAATHAKLMGTDVAAGEAVRVRFNLHPKGLTPEEIPPTPSERGTP